MDKTSINAFEERYGKEEGVKFYDKHREKLSYSNSEKFYTDIYGDVIGTLKWEEKKNNSSHSKENYKKWYGEFWEEKWDIRIKSLCTSLDGFIERHGNLEGIKRYNKYLFKMRKTLEDNFVWVKEEDIPKFTKYYRGVWKITNTQNISLCKNNKDRGRGKYHLDHIISIKYGFENDIESKVIGDINNIQFIKEKENASKRANCYSEISQCIHIKEKYERILK